MMSRLPAYLYNRYFLRDGRVYESGTHDQLTARRGAYWEYTQQQQLSAAE